MIWIYGAITGLFVLGYLIGFGAGKRKALADQDFNRRQMEATRMWTENLGKYMGGMK